MTYAFIYELCFHLFHASLHDYAQIKFTNKITFIAIPLKLSATISIINLLALVLL